MDRVRGREGESTYVHTTGEDHEVREERKEIGGGRGTEVETGITQVMSLMKNPLLEGATKAKMVLNSEK